MRKALSFYLLLNARKSKILEEAKAEMQRELRKQKEEEEERRLAERKAAEAEKMKREIEKQEQTIMEMRSNMQVCSRVFFMSP